MILDFLDNRDASRKWNNFEMLHTKLPQSVPCGCDDWGECKPRLKIAYEKARLTRLFVPLFSLCTWRARLEKLPTRETMKPSQEDAFVGWGLVTARQCRISHAVFSNQGQEVVFVAVIWAKKLTRFSFLLWIFRWGSCHLLVYLHSGGIQSLDMCLVWRTWVNYWTSCLQLYFLYEGTYWNLLYWKANYPDPSPTGGDFRVGDIMVDIQRFSKISNCWRLLRAILGAASWHI